MTLFACFFPIELVFPIFDMFLEEGWKAIFRIGIAFLQEIEPILMQMDMIEICTYFRDKVRSELVTEPFKLFSRASRVRVNKILVITSIISH